MMKGKVLTALTLALVASLFLNMFFIILVLHYQERIRLLEGLGQTSQQAFSSLEGWSWINVVAVSQDGEGVILKLYAKIEGGSGRVYMATTPKVGIDLQASAETAYKVAGQLCGFDVGKNDLFLLIAANFTVDVVDGPSAGASIAVLLICMMQMKSINSSVMMTGTIRPDGTIGKVGGIVEKALAAAKAGAAVFLVPKGQAVTITYVEHQIRVGPFLFITKEPVEVNVQDYLRDRGYYTKIFEVSDVLEALKYFSS